ncbi:MAG: PAS domain S-box protein [candidate division KSB1 bacterium]|nr:PAS domain S-box protein [candidate division KSB1 bacterium]
MKRDSKAKILLVEDDQAQARLMMLAIARGQPDCHVDQAANGSEALEMLRREQYEALVLDYNLPLMDGLALMQAMQREKINVPVVMTTGEGSEEVAVEAMKRGAYDYLIKRPGYLDVLPRVVAKAIERHRLESELRRTELKYRTLVAMASDAIFVEDLESGKLVEVNARAEELTGRSRRELLATTMAVLYPPEEQAKVEKLRAQALQGKIAVLDELRLCHADGHEVFAEVSSSVVDLGDKRVLQTIVRDVTQRRRLEQQILLSKQRLQAAFDGIQDMIAVVDTRHTIIMANRHLAQRCQVAPSELVGRRCYEAIFRRSSPCEECHVPKVLSQGQQHFEERETEGAIFQLWCYPMPGLDGRPELVVEHVKEVTEQKRMEQHLIQSEKLATVGMLSSGIAHELRNPLSIIESARYYLQETLGEVDGEVRDKLEMIQRNVRRAAAIINNLLEFSRRSEHEREMIDVQRVIDATLLLLEKELASRHIRVVREEAHLPRVCFNVDSLKQVFLNLILNAVQAMPEGGVLGITSRLTPDGQRVEVDISDTGCGIAPEQLKHLFAPFYTTKRVGEGTGLGLYISRSIMRRYGGDIAVQSEVGQGSTFTVQIPVEGAASG